VAAWKDSLFAMLKSQRSDAYTAHPSFEKHILRDDSGYKVHFIPHILSPQARDLVQLWRIIFRAGLH
jgi:hypothetical protein